MRHHNSKRQSGATEKSTGKNVDNHVGRSIQQRMSLLPASRPEGQDEAVLTQARNSAYVMLVNSVLGKTSGVLTGDMETLLSDTAEVLGINTRSTSSQPRRKFLSSVDKNNSSNLNSDTKRRSSRKNKGKRSLGDDHHNDSCEVCNKDSGDLLCCDLCSLVFHVSCVRPCLDRVPAGDWWCAYCELDRVRSSVQEEEESSCTSHSGASHSGASSGSESGALSAIRTMKLLNAVSRVAQDNSAVMTETRTDDRRQDDKQSDDEILAESEKSMTNLYELSGLLSIYKIDSRYIVKRLDAATGQHVELSRFWSVEEALFEARRLSVMMTAAASGVEGVSSSLMSDQKKLRLSEKQLGIISACSGTDAQVFTGYIPFEKKTKREQGGGGRVEEEASDLWCSACVDDPNVVYCAFCGCKNCFGKHDLRCLLSCDLCEEKYHSYCLSPALQQLPLDSWFCEQCAVLDSGLRRRDSNEGLGEGLSDGLLDDNERRSEAVELEEEDEKKKSDLIENINISEGSKLDNSNVEAVSEVKLDAEGKTVAVAGVGGSKQVTGKVKHKKISSKHKKRKKSEMSRSEQLVSLVSVKVEGEGNVRVSSFLAAGSEQRRKHRRDKAKQGAMSNRDEGIRKHVTAVSDSSLLDNTTNNKNSISHLDKSSLDLDASSSQASAARSSPPHIPMKRQRVESVVSAIRSRGWLPEEINLLEQFRDWAPVDELQAVTRLLYIQKEKILKSLLDLDPSFNVKEFLSLS